MMDYGLKGADFWKLNWSPGKCFCLLWKMGNISAALEGYNLENNLLLISFSFMQVFFGFFFLKLVPCRLCCSAGKISDETGEGLAMDKYKLILTYAYKALTPPSVTYFTGDVTPPANCLPKKAKPTTEWIWNKLENLCPGSCRVLQPNVMSTLFFWMSPACCVPH